MSNLKANFYDAVVRQKAVRSRCGYLNDPQSARWALHGVAIDFDAITETVTPAFLSAIKQVFGTLLNAAQHDDATISYWFTSLKDCLHYAWRGTGFPAEALTDTMIDEWIEEASGAYYPYSLKLLIVGARKRDSNSFPGISEKILKKLRKPPAEVEHILSLNPNKGPWLEREILDQDLAIERAYTSGAWHVERYVLVQLLRLYGMRTAQLSYMKIADVRLRLWGNDRDEIRWPFVKNDEGPEKALWWPLGGALLPALVRYVEIRLSSIPRQEWDRLPLFTPEGVAGAWKNEGLKPRPNEEIGYEGHPMNETIGGRFRRSMNSLGLKTNRSGLPQLMHFGPHRERHTVGVRLALKGYTAQMIALRLGHKSRESCSAYVDLARMAMQLRDPKFFHMMDDVGALFTAPVASRDEIEADLDPIISLEASTSSEIALIGGADCGHCMFAGDSSAPEPWPCLSCPRFQLFEEADLQPLWDILQERKAYMYHEDGSWNNRFDPDIRAQFDRYEALLIGAEARRREVISKRILSKEASL